MKTEWRAVDMASSVDLLVLMLLMRAQAGRDVVSDVLDN